MCGVVQVMWMVSAFRVGHTDGMAAWTMDMHTHTHVSIACDYSAHQTTDKETITLLVQGICIHYNTTFNSVYPAVHFFLVLLFTFSRSFEIFVLGAHIHIEQFGIDGTSQHFHK